MRQIVSWLKNDDGKGPRWLLLLCGLAILYVLFIGEAPPNPWY